MSLRIALVDLAPERGGCKDREVTGTFGSAMNAGGLAGRLFGLAKGRRLRLPLLHHGHLAAIFRRAGHRVTIHRDAPDEADLVLVATSIVGWHAEREFARSLPRRRRGCTVGFTGAFAAARPELFLDGGGDFVVTGEPEAWASSCADPSAARGVVGGAVVEDLETLPPPDWQGFPLTDFGYWPLLRRRPFLIAATSRGCPHGCSYCHYGPSQGKTWRVRSIPSVMAELERNVRDFGCRSLLFRDLVFTQDRTRCLALSTAMKEARLGLDWACETRPDLLDEDCLDAMAAAGLKAVNFGVEALDEEVLEGCGRRGLPWERLRELVSRCRSLGVRTNAFWILGFPEDDPRRIRRRIDRAVALDTDLAQFCVLTPMPGTPFFHRMEEEGRLEDVDWSAYTTYDPVLRLDGLGAHELRALRDEAYRRFYLRPGWFLRRGPALLVSS